MMARQKIESNFRQKHVCPLFGLFCGIIINDMYSILYIIEINGFNSLNVDTLVS